MDLNNQDVTQLLAEMMGLSSEKNNAFDVNDLSQLVASQFPDPLSAALFNSMLRQYAANNEAHKNRVDYEQTLVRAKRLIKRLKKDLAAAQAVANYFAETFGACPDCWGQDDACPRCEGSGKPGSTYPVKAELLALVEPALKKLGLGVTRQITREAAGSHQACNHKSEKEETDERRTRIC